MHTVVQDFLFSKLNGLLYSLWGMVESMLVSDLTVESSNENRKDLFNQGSNNKDVFITKFDSDTVDLFNQPTSYSKVIASDPLVRSCAVDEFDLDFSNPNPYNWDIDGLVSHTTENTSHTSHLNASYNIKQHLNETPQLESKPAKTADVKSTHEIDVYAAYSSDEEELSDDDNVVFPLDDELNLSYVTCSQISHSDSPTFSTTKSIPAVTEKRDLSQTTAEHDIQPNKKARKMSMDSTSMDNLSSSSSPETKLSPNSTDNSYIANASKKVYICPHCSTPFRVKGYLTRHLKKHAEHKPFVCPYYDINSVSKCHQTGGFSRRDTFKTHLKALHFVYPTGTKSGERGNKQGRCAGCFKQFESNGKWLADHVMKNNCEAMLKQYQ
ncbi:hypothetical protein DAMA08_036630 [Martiniozyma asiatica (nom. inval.)]|nr:hypothetical protein DAMA08_036630 [Martiniozyma asiatica]